MHAKKKFAVLGALSVVAVAGAGVAIAQQLDPGISCINGSVQPMTFAAMESNYKESMWDSKSAIRLRSDTDELELLVTDIYGNTVCEDTADLKVRCKFTFASTYEGVFNVKVENKRAVTSSYRLCAE